MISQIFISLVIVEFALFLAAVLLNHKKDKDEEPATSKKVTLAFVAAAMFILTAMSGTTRVSCHDVIDSTETHLNTTTYHTSIACEEHATEPSGVTISLFGGMALLCLALGLLWTTQIWI